MDAKALAKSKRAHSQHHTKKHNPNQASKAPSTGTIGAASPSAKQVRVKSGRSQGSSLLPSNWDRYEEEFNDSGSENLSQDSLSKATDVVLPKSKGADYTYLISEAKAQSQTQSFDSFASFDDSLSDFYQGVGSLLSVKGHSILSWIADDNFIVEDKATSSREASFLSLNLHALAEQLAKSDLSQRLFIEADLLPPELCIELRASSDQESGQDQAPSRRYMDEKDSDSLVSHGVSEGDKYTDQDTTTTTSHPFPAYASDGSKSINQVKDEVQHFGCTSQSIFLESTAELNLDSIANPAKKPSRFEAAAAEAELDMLLDSFSGAKFLDSHGITEKSGHTSYLSQGETSTSLLEGISSVRLVPAEPVKKGPDLSSSALISANLDDSIDDLLNQTSSLINQNSPSQSSEVKAAPSDVLSSSSLHPASKSKLLDDFDSWLDTI